MDDGTALFTASVNKIARMGEARYQVWLVAVARCTEKWDNVRVEFF
jgi:hypothetical protein